MPTHDWNAFPWPLCANLLAKPCKPPLCVSRLPNIPTSGFASPGCPLCPLTALSIESSNPITYFLSFVGFQVTSNTRENQACKTKVLYETKAGFPQVETGKLES